MSIVFFALLFVTGVVEARLASDPSECTPEEHWVTAHDRVVNGRSVAVRSSCAANPAGYSTWSPRVRTQFKPSGWPHDEQFKAWKSDELEDFYEAVGVLPEVLRSIRVQSVHRASRSIYGRENLAANGGGYIVLYDGAFRNKRQLSKVIAHELAHFYFNDVMIEKERLSYAQATGWRELFDAATQTMRTVPRSAGYVEVDGKNNPEEDFCNNIHYFLFDRRKLHTVTPKAEGWLLNHFGDKLRLVGEVK